MLPWIRESTPAPQAALDGQQTNVDHRSLLLRAILIPVVALAIAAGVFALTWSPSRQPNDPANQDDPAVRAESLEARTPLPKAERAPSAMPAPTAPASRPPATSASVEVDWSTAPLRRRDTTPRIGSRTPIVIQPSQAGIRCPDGQFLPLLNGVTSAPAIIREPERGPLPPVVAIVVDAEGWEWYEHADGAMTTSRPQRIKDQVGRECVQTVTLHVARLPADGMVAPTPSSYPSSRLPTPR